MDKQKITRFPRRLPRIHIDFILLVFVFIYIIFHAVSYFTGTHIPVTEVKQGQIVSNDHLSAVAIRKETLVHTKASGQAVYIVASGSIAASGESVLGVDSSGTLVSELRKSQKGNDSLSDDQRSRLSDLLSNFNDAYSSDSFRDVYLLKQNSSDILNQASSSRIRSTIRKISGTSLTSVKAPSSGLVSLSYDNLNGITAGKVSEDTFDESALKTTELSSGDELKTGDTAFRLITDDNWELMAPISDSMAEELKDTGTIQIRFIKDGTYCWTTSTIIRRNGKNYLLLSLDDSMDRFADSRFLDIELVMDRQSGLKIPASSVLTKILYEIPAKYVTHGGDSKTPGVNVKTSEGYKFRRFLIYQKDENTGDYWASFTGAVTSGVISDPADLNDELKLSDCEVKKTYGVYLANKGYTQFVQINILYRNEQYCIIEPINENALRLYDHIVLKAKGVKDGQMLND